MMDKFMVLDRECDGKRVEGVQSCRCQGMIGPCKKLARYPEHPRLFRFGGSRVEGLFFRCVYFNGPWRRIRLLR